MSTALQDFHFQPPHRAPFFPLNHHTISGEEEACNKQETTFAYNHDPWFSGMAKVSQTISDVIVKKLTEISNVKAIRMGRSGDIYHVWTLIQNWTAADRKNVYAAQKELLIRLNGFDLDFYVVKLDANTTPDELVSDIPAVFPVVS